MSYQQQQKTPFCALTIKMYATGKTAPKFEFKANAESLFTCSLTKKKYKLSQINEWYLSPEVQKFHNEGYRAKWYGKTEHNENPNKYSQGDTNFVLSFIMIKPYKPQPNVDGMKPIEQAIPYVQQTSQPITTSGNYRPEEMANIKRDESFDDDLPPF